MQDVSNPDRRTEQQRADNQEPFFNTKPSETLSPKSVVMALFRAKVLSAWSWGQTNNRDLLYWGLFVFFSFFTVLPLWILNYLPLGDLPEHAGQIQVILNYENYQEDYRINWFTPYLVAYGLTILLSQVFSVVTSIKIVLSLAVLAFPVSLLMLTRQLGGDRYWALIGFPASFSFSLYWGFYSFVVGSALAMLFFVFVVAFARHRITIGWYLGAFLFSLLLFSAHLLSWGVAVSAAPLILLIHNSFKESVIKSTAFFLVAPLAAYWMSISGEASGAPSALIENSFFITYAIERVGLELSYIIDMFNNRSAQNVHILRAKELFGFAIGRAGQWEYVVLTSCLLLWPLICGAKLSLDVRRWLPLIYCIGLFMIVPYSIMNVFYVYPRFAVFLLPFALFVYVKRNNNSEVAEPFSWYRFLGFSSGVIIIFLILASNYSLLYSFKKDDKNFSAVIDKMAPGKMVQSLIFEGHSHLAFTPAYLHFGVWYQAVKGGAVTFSFSHDPLSYVVPVRYKKQSWSQPSPWNAREFNWQRHSGPLYDYFLIRSLKPRDYLFKESKDIVLITHQGMWYLYGREGLKK